MTAPLYSPAVVRQLLARHGLRPDKRLGQNYLVDGNILRHIVAAVNARPGDTVLEIGPGLGVLTRELALTGARVIAVEKDRRLAPVLVETLAGTAVHLVWGDALEVELDLPAGTIVAGNLPYNMGTAMVARFLCDERVVRLVHVLQKEVAQRALAQPGDEQYGFYSLLVAMCAVGRLLRVIPPGAFYPRPEVSSALIELRRTGAQVDQALLDFIAAGFAHRRKTLVNSLRASGYQLDPSALQALGLDMQVRAEALALDQFQRLFSRAVRP
ncbi:MAG: ribosomal RNA small subunit methyltransferase A [Deinococcus sp.]|nr:ribosomal RNA small subunit methyltransferase A [Deinococcus sp.]